MDLPDDLNLDDDLDKDDETAEGQGNEKINYYFTRQI
jgi:hypothetical protein